jgi:hypothetical protein
MTGPDSASGAFDSEVLDGDGAGGFKPMMRFVTLLAVADIAIGACLPPT